MKATDIRMMAGYPIPAYLIGVDEPAPRAFIVSVHATLSGAISSTPTAYLLDRRNRKLLWDEVRVVPGTPGGPARRPLFRDNPGRA
jgi:hypothetical protein